MKNSLSSAFATEYPVFSSNRIFSNLVEYGDSFLLTQFREFYQEIIKLAYIVKTSNWIYPDDSLDIKDIDNKDQFHDTTKVDSSKIATMVCNRLLYLLENQAIEARHRGGNFGYEFYREAQYVMVALADEIFLNLDWAGKSIWISSLLESKLFKSHVAGELIFLRIDKLLQSSDPIYRDLAAVYLMALSLGFLGKYRGVYDVERVLIYRQQLFSFIFHYKPNFNNQSQLCSEAYSIIARQEEKQKLPSPGKWIVTVILSIIAYLLISNFLWDRLITPLHGINSAINKEVESLQKK